MKRVAILGATGSIGASTLDVIARHPDRYRVEILSAYRDAPALARLCGRFRPRRAVIADHGATAALHRALQAEGLDIEVDSGSEALERAAADSSVDVVVAAIVGAAGMRSSLAAAEAGKHLLLANKEAVVMAGSLMMDAVRRGGGRLIPLDSEHNAIFQCLPSDYARDPARHGISRLILTASGGPFRGRSRESLRAVTPEQACAHPRWNMGRKISVDSATLMNKGLEVIEAHHLFGVAADAIDVLVHPESCVHSLVEYADGSQLAQLGSPDMRTPIAHALAWPDRIDAGVPRLDLAQLGRLQFESPDWSTFPCLSHAFSALRAGGNAAIVLNAANEIAVAGFLEQRIEFLDIERVVAECLQRIVNGSTPTLEAVLACDAETRALASQLLQRIPA